MSATDTFLYTSYYPCSARELYAFHARPGALERLLPPWENTKILWKKGSIAPGGKVGLKLHMGPIPLTWEAHHIENIPPRMFRDIQHKGPFAAFSHTHTFTDTDNGARLEDRIEFSLPGHSLLPEIVVRHVRKMLGKSFAYREHVLREDMAIHARYSRTPLRILISGASGVLGSSLVPLLTSGGHDVITLVRRKADPEKQEIFWNPETGEIDKAAIPEIDAVIHLAGEYIGLSRWSAEKKRRVMESRTKGTTLLAETVGTLPVKPKVFLSASAVGYYGNSPGLLLTEDDPAGSDYISRVCRAWERSAARAAEKGIRTVQLRLGVGLTPRGGALERLQSASPLGYIRYFGNGEQSISWMSIDDMIAAILHCMVTPDISGPVNIAAPNPVTNKELVQTLSEVTGRPRLHPIPGWTLQALYGQMASEILLSSCRVSTKKLEQSGFRFRHPELSGGLKIMLGKIHPSPHIS